MKRLEMYSRNMVDHHMLFLGRLRGVKLTYLQVAILLATGLQHRDVDRSANLSVGQQRPQTNTSVNTYPSPPLPSKISSSPLTSIIVTPLPFPSIAAELDLPVNQVLAFFNKTIRKIAQHLRELLERQVDNHYPLPTTNNK